MPGAAASEAAGVEDKVKELEEGSPPADAAELLGDANASVAELSRGGDEVGWVMDEVELTGDVPLRETAGGEAGTELFLPIFSGDEVADLGSLLSSPSCCCCGPSLPFSPPFFFPVAAANAMLDVFCSSSADGRLLNEADRKPRGVVLPLPAPLPPLPPFFFQKANLASASPEAAAVEEEAEAAEVGEADDDDGWEGGAAVCVEPFAGSAEADV